MTITTTIRNASKEPTFHTLLVIGEAIGLRAIKSLTIIVRKSMDTR